MKKTGLEEKKAGVVHNLVEGEKNGGPWTVFRGRINPIDMMMLRLPR